MKAILKNYKQSPRKVRKVVDVIRGKDVITALRELSFINKRVALPIKKLLLSAISNAKESIGIGSENLRVKEVRVDKGIVLKRSRSAWRGTAHPIKHRRASVQIMLVSKDLITDKKGKKEMPAVSKKDDMPHDKKQKVKE